MFSKTILLLACVCLFSLLSPTRAQAYDFLNPLSVWPDGTIPMDLQLGSPGAVLIDGNTSWNAVAEGALATWNDYINIVRFTLYTYSQGPHADGDGVNQVFFSSTVYGQSFGSRVLAVTTRWRNGSERTEGDTVFNNAKPWNSYRGNLRDAAGGGTLYDVRRVALHEFGHTLGLDHPDDWGQNVYALMNSTIGDLDGLTLDDVHGAQALYYRLPPTITTQPQNQTVSVGSSATFSVIANGIPTPTYQWYWKGSLLPSGNTASITVSAVQPDFAGAFQVIVSNSRGSVTSAPAILTVLYPPAIVAQPQNKAVAVGQSVSFNITAKGVPSPDYQWYLNGDLILGAVGASYTISSAQNSDAGDYTVSVSNSQGSVPSQSATLQVLPVPLGVFVRPADQIAFVGTNLVFIPELISVGSFSCQWLLNGKKLRGQTSPTLTLYQISLRARGDYQLEVRNAFGVIRSDPAHVTVVVPPTIVSQPRPITARIGKHVTFRVSAKGSKPLIYQWIKDGVDIPGATYRTFKISSAQNSDTGTYSVRMTNIGASRESASAQLSVIP